MSLSLASDATHRAPTPSVHAAMALQKLYNLTLKHWEPSIFCGLLASYAASSTTPSTSVPAIDFPPVSAPKYGASTPTKEFDQSLLQWTNLTPGLGGDFSALFGAGFAPRESSQLPSNLGQFEFHPEHDNNQLVGESIGGIDEILASMEKDQEDGEREIVRAAASTQVTPITVIDSVSVQPNSLKSRSSSAFQLPTPETDSDHAHDTPHRQSSVQVNSQLSPESMASPFVTASSGTTSQVSKELNAPAAAVSGPSRAAHPTSLVMPTEAFVPPPPMCMFFNPSFRDLQKGKVGVWKGDLNLKGKGGGIFNVLIVGEEVSGHLW